MPEQDLDIGERPGLVYALGVLRARWLLIVMCMVVSTAVAIAYVGHKPNQYTATSSLQFTNNSLSAQVAGGAAGQALDPEGEKDTNVQLVTSTAVAAMVIEALHLHTTPGELLDQVTVTDPQNDYIVDISVTDENAAEAARIANAFAQYYVIYSQQQNEQQLIKGQALIARKTAQLPPDDTADRANLNALSQKLLLLQSVASANARVATTAEVPTEPSSPKRKATAVVALIFGLLIGVALAFLSNLLTRRVGRPEEIEALYDLRAIAGIPQLTHAPRTALEREIELEPYHILQNGLSLLVPDGRPKVVLVTSAVPGEGKTTVAIGLARSAARSGLSVVLVEADLRRPTFAQHLRVDPRADGLATALFADEDPLELLQTPFPEMPRLRVLTGGAAVPDAASKLRPYELARVFDRLSSHVDLVVIDSAPLLPVVDTRVLLDELALDAQLIVARAGVTKREEIMSVRSLLDQRHLKSSVGLVINAIPTTSSDYYYAQGVETPGAERRPKVPSS